MRSPGDAFPDRALPDLGGREHRLSEAWASGRGLIVIGHGDCRTTRLTLPYVDRIDRRRGEGSSVVAVLQDEVGAASDLVAELQLAMPIRIESDPYPIASQLGLVTVPTLALVGKDGTILQVSEGFRRDHLEELSRALGAPPPLFAPGDEAPALRPG